MQLEKIAIAHWSLTTVYLALGLHWSNVVITLMRKIIHDYDSPSYSTY